MRYVAALMLIAAALGPPGVKAQGFAVFSGRNHAELRWKQAETPHFQIMYPRHLEGIAAEAAPIAEASYEVFSTNFGVTFDRKIRIYLSDEDEIVNGVAVRVGNGHTNIWVHQNDPEHWSGRNAWLRHVIAHELAHIFHFRAVRSNAGLWQFLLANPLPRFWTEGLAQYQSEEWNAQRGDRWLRTAVLDDRLSYSDGRSVWNGRLLYAIGHSQVRYFASQYGDSALAQMLSHRSPRLLGLVRVHDFGEALRATVDRSYRAFYDDWRRHMNVYYNTIAGRMENVDSLEAEPMNLPGQYVYDVQFSPDTTRIAVVALTSVRRPVRRLLVIDRETKRTRVLAEGAIRSPASWSPDGRRLAFSQLARGPNGALINDLFLADADGGRLERLTRGGRASSPSFSPDGTRLAYARSRGGTANIWIRDLASSTDTMITRYAGDVQIAGVRWAPAGDKVAYALFDENGRRAIAVVDVSTGVISDLSTGSFDDRSPVWSRDGRRLAFTSLRDDVPNVFVQDLDADDAARVTFLAQGATATDWLPPDSANAAGRLVVVASVSKERDRAYRISASRRVRSRPVEVPPEYTRWTRLTPASRLDPAYARDPSLVLETRSYSSWRHITHAASIALPYYASPDDWGVFGLTSWIEPLGKHVFAFAGGLSFPQPQGNSFFFGTYVNNQLFPTVSLSGYRFPGSLRIYGQGLLVERLTGGEVGVRWPIDVGWQPYASTSLTMTARLAAYDPLNVDELANDLGALPEPESGEQADLTAELAWKKLRPYMNNVVHPLDGKGVRVRLTAAAAVLGTDRRFTRGDLSGYIVVGGHILPALHRLFLYGRAQVQEGRPFPQDYLGFARYDDVRVDVPGFEQLLTGDAERVRGYRRYAIGNRLGFASVEYRMPLLPDLRTQLLGVLALGASTLSLVADAGIVWTGADFDAAERRTGVGVELKNALRLGGSLQIMHALGWAQPVKRLRRADGEGFYYRIGTSLPF